jgi:DHA1 family multidrug resistance protein-like MFS transporter
LLYPVARLGERYLTLEARLLGGIGIMSCAVLAMAAAHSLPAMFTCIAVFYTGSLAAEPARASYMGLSRIGLAVGGLSGYTAGGWLLDLGLSLGIPALPWLLLGAIGMLTLAVLAQGMAAKKEPAVSGGLNTLVG